MKKTSPSDLNTQRKQRYYNEIENYMQQVLFICVRVFRGRIIQNIMS